MVDVDTRLKRQSATCILMPFMLSSAPPDTLGIVQTEWQAMAWMYSGIKAQTPVVYGSASVDHMLVIFSEDRFMSIGNENRRMAIYFEDRFMSIGNENRKIMVYSKDRISDV